MKRGGGVILIITVPVKVQLPVAGCLSFSSFWKKWEEEGVRGEVVNITVRLSILIMLQHIFLGWSLILACFVFSSKHVWVYGTLCMFSNWFFLGHYFNQHFPLGWVFTQNVWKNIVWFLYLASECCARVWVKYEFGKMFLTACNWLLLIF